MLSRQLKDWFLTEDWLQQKYQRVVVAFSSTVQGLVPRELQKAGTKTFFDQAFNLRGEQKYFSENLVGGGATNAWAWPKDEFDQLQEMLGEFEVVHASTSFLNQVFTEGNKNHPRDNFLGASVCGDQLELALMQSSELVFQNIFSFETPEDFTYYLLMVCENFQLNPEKLTLRFYGEIDPDSTFIEIAEQYLGNIQFAERPQDFKYARQLDFIPDHYFFNLFSLAK